MKPDIHLPSLHRSPSSQSCRCLRQETQREETSPVFCSPSFFYSCLVLVRPVGKGSMPDSPQSPGREPSPFMQNLQLQPSSQIHSVPFATARISLSSILHSTSFASYSGTPLSSTLPAGNSAAQPFLSFSTHPRPCTSCLHSLYLHFDPSYCILCSHSLHLCWNSVSLTHTHTHSRAHAQIPL